MSVRDIIEIGHPTLRQPARKVGEEELHTPAIQKLVDDLIETMRAAKGAGLAAPQIDEGVRICVLEVKDNPRYPYKPNIPLTVLINPVLEPLEDTRFDNYEGCLSVPNLRGIVSRYAKLSVKALDRDGKPFERTVQGITAGTYQHECDHLDGKLFVDRVTNTETFCTWDAFKRFHEADFRAHVKSVVATYGS